VRRREEARGRSRLRYSCHSVRITAQSAPVRHSNSLWKYAIWSEKMDLRLSRALGS